MSIVLGTIAYVAGSTAAMYVSTLVAVRLAGRRTITQVSAFDVIVTIALGSIIATSAVSDDQNYVKGVTAVTTLVALQIAAGALRQTSRTARRLLDFRPVVVVHGGETQLSSAPTGPQMTPDELRSKLRAKGIFDLESVALVLLEPDGSISVLHDAESGPPGDAAIP